MRNCTGAVSEVDKLLDLLYYIVRLKLPRFLRGSLLCRCGEIGRHEGLKIPFWRQSTGSTPVGGITRERSVWPGAFLCKKPLT